MKQKKWSGRRRAGVILAAGSAGSLLLLGLAGPAGASNPKIAIAQGLGAHELSTLPFPIGTGTGDTPSDTPETVSFVLQMRNEHSLEASVSAGMPRGYLSVRQFAAEYGQTQGNISALRHYLSGYGITASSDADGLDVTANGTAGEFDRALSVQQHQYQLAAVKASDGRLGRKAMVVHGTTDTPLLPRSIGQDVLAVLGLDDYPTFGNDAVKAVAPQKRTASDGSGTAAPFLAPPSYFTSEYDLTPLLNKGATGAGQTIGIVTLAALNPADPEYFWNNVLGITTKPNRITLDNIDGGPTGGVTSAVGSDETTLDVEQSGAIAPDANIVVYQAPNTDPGFTGAFYTAASQNIAGSVSASWGESETVIQTAINAGFEDPNYVQTFDNVFLEMAAQGQSVFTSSDDEGAYGATDDEGSTNLAVDNPADSPWVTAAGGTTAAGTQDYGTFSITVPQTRAWGWDYLWPYWSDFGADNQLDWVGETLAGSGGGFSVDEATPSYQQGINGTHRFSAVKYLTPTGYAETDGLYLPSSFSFNADPSVTSGYGNGRALPDVSTNADPQTGYELYFSEFGAGEEIQDYGGTSFVAPQLNGSTAVINSYLGHRVGFWNPSIYQFATLHNSPFTPLDASGTSNDNLYYTGTRGTIYNEGTGLGTPNLAELANDFAHYGG